MRKNIFFIIGLIGLLLVTTTIFAQGTLQVSGPRGGSIPGRPGFFRAEGGVTIWYGRIRILSDYAEYNKATSDFEARGNLRIRTPEGAVITGRRLINYPRLNAMVVDQDVVFTDADSTQLFTDRLTYNRITEISTYTTGGRIVSDSTVLTSLIGHYHGKTKAFHCKTNVVITHPDYLIHTDSLQMINNVIYFFSPTHVWSDSNYLYCERGWYKTNEKIASLVQNAFVQTPEQKMYGDSIYYEMENDFGMAFGNVTVIDSVNDIIIHSEFALSDKPNGIAWFTENPVGIVISDNDSLFLRGDTLRIAYDTNDDVRHILAYHNVRFFRHDMQGASDSLAYVVQDSTLTMFGSPIVWTSRDQLTGDTIQILLTENRPKQMILSNNAFIISEGYHEGHFNQVKGREVFGFFNDSSELERVRVYDFVETIYFVTDDLDSSLIGILKVNAERMEIILERQAIVSINYFNPEAGTMFPEAELPKQDRYLEGFLWQYDRRPRSKTDIWSRAQKREQIMQKVQ